MDRVLVTGGCGFIGSKIVECLLEKNYEVHIIDDLSTGKKENVNLEKVQLYVEDINNPEIEEIFKNTKFKYIIHQAAQTSVPHSIEHIQIDTEINVSGSIHMIDLARKYGVEKIIFASTAAIYGNPDVLPITEGTLANPASPYGLSKYTVEQYLKLAHQLYGLDYVILRYANVYGPKQTVLGEGGVVSIFDQLFSQGETPSIFGDGKQTRDFIFVDDVAAANVAALNAKNEVFNISCNKQTTILELFELFTELYKQNTKPIFELPREGDIKDSTLDNTRALKKLNWEPRISIREGLEKTF